jgi:hypothetical protein
MVKSERSLFVATPMYGGQCYGAYTDAMIKLAVECAGYNIKFRFFPIFNESHIDRARNVCVDEFRKSGFSHLFFIDADIQFNPVDALGLIERDLPIVCGFYPKKQIAWHKVVEAVQLGWADDDPNVLERFATELVFTPAQNAAANATRSIYDLTEIHEGGTGFMCIKREVFEKIAPQIPWSAYHKTGPQSEKMTAFFDARVTSEPYSRFLSEDYAFCALARTAGYKIWLAPWIKLTHHGYYRWIGDIEALSKVAMKEVA